MRVNIEVFHIFNKGLMSTWRGRDCKPIESPCIGPFYEIPDELVERLISTAEEFRKAQYDLYIILYGTGGETDE